MRLIARRIAAVAAVLLGLACVSAAAIGSETPLIGGRPEAPGQPVETAGIPPFDPASGGSELANQASARQATSFDSEYGDRGEHEVTVTVRGGANYVINWRDKQTKTSTGATTWSRTITGGFPLVQVAVQAVFADGTCTITIDGEIRDTQSTSKDRTITFCEA